MSQTAERIDHDTLTTGTVLKHKSGGHVTLYELKADGSGWWNTDSSGLCWAAIDSGDWTVVGRSGGGWVWSDRTRFDVARVQAAMDRWRAQNDPADENGFTMAEYVVIALEQEDRLR